MITVPITAVIGENDDFIRAEHILYLADTVANGKYVSLPSLGHFVAVQDPMEFNAVLKSFLA